jgi:serine/threonine-protein kinase
MPTPQEKRFLRLAMAQKTLSPEQCEACVELQAKKLQEGSKVPLWDCAVLQNMLDQDVAEKLQELAGDLNVEKLGGYSIVRKLGQGGMGSVWMALDANRQRVALKVLPPHLAQQRQFLTRFFREAQSAIKLQHPNIVRGLAVGEEARQYFFAMEYVDGRSVSDMMKRSGAVPPEQATQIMLQVAEGLAYAHEHGIIHRDIKPDNIMLTRDGVAKLADLGLARQVDAEMTALTRTGTAMGTPYYMAPEQGTDAKRADARSDIYALGATWYHMITGRVPFDGSTPLEIWQKHLKEPIKAPSIIQEGIPRPVSQTIERMMAKDPERRVQTAAELCQVIRERCMGERDLATELGMNRPQAQETLWDMMVPAAEGVEKRRLSLSEVRTRIRKGQIKRDTPARLAGTRSEYQAASAFRELAREFPRDYATPTQVKKGEATTRMQLHELVTRFDDAQRAYTRKRRLRTYVRYAVEVAVLAVVAIVVWQHWPAIWKFATGLLGKGKPAP